MAGNVIQGSTNITTGGEFFYPEWYAKLYPRLGGEKFKNVYLAGWMNEAGAELVAAPNVTQMEYVGTGDSPTVGNVAALNNVPAFSGWDGSLRISTGYTGGNSFTLIALANITAAMIAGTAGGESRLMSRFSGGTNIGLGVSVSGAAFFQIEAGVAESIISESAADLTAGPNLLMATLNETAADTYDMRLFVNDLTTPAAQRTDVAHTMASGGVWDVGSIGANSFWRGDIAGWMILEGDITQDATGYATLKALLPAALTWMTPA